jgi:hypothetical protein
MLQIVWRNPGIPPWEIDELQPPEVPRGLSLCIVHRADGEVIFRIDEGQSPRRVMEVKRGGGA